MTTPQTAQWPPLPLDEWADTYATLHLMLQVVAAGRCPTRLSMRTRIRREAFYSTDLREFILPYDAVRLAASPDAALLEFLQSTYVAAAENAKWDREALERA